MNYIALNHPYDAKPLLLYALWYGLWINYVIIPKAGCDLVNYVIEKLEQ